MSGGLSLFRLGSPFRHLYTKIFLWFFATVFVTLILSLALALLTNSQPFGRRWMALTQDLYAHSATDFYLSGGPEGLRRYLTMLADGSGVQGQLLNADGHDVLGQPVMPGSVAVLEKSKLLGRSSLRLAGTWAAASPVMAGGRRYTFLMQLSVTRRTFDGTFLFPVLPKLLLGVVLVGGFCLLLARHITGPIGVLELAATELADGALHVRAGPRIGPRKDELARMAAAFDAMAERIQGLLYAQQEMLGHISHELRSPLTRIGVSLELMRRGEYDSLDRIQIDLDHMNRMIGEILQITRMDLQTHAARAGDGDRIVRPEVDLFAMLEPIALDAAFEAQPLRKRVVFTGEQGICVKGDVEELRSCCENVIRNALIYTLEETLIEIVLTSNTTDGMATILVEDEGPGVPGEALGHLFELFYRAPAAQEKYPDGTGFGLAIAQRIVAMHGGSITAENREPQGLSVRIVLPLVPR